MATPRRSSRLRSQTPQKEDRESTNPVSVTKLSSLVERDETPNRGVQTSIDSITSPNSTNHETLKLSISATSPMAGQLKPTSDQMYGLLHESVDKSAKRKHNITEEDPSVAQVSAQHKSTASSSPKFEFTFQRPSTELSPDGKKMMDEVREQVARIKGELAAHRDTQLKKDSEAEATLSADGRKIATPKGKVGRFSDVHMKQFKRMDSIANHASSYRADSIKSLSPGKSLKRSNSKAGLDKPDSQPKPTPSGKSTIESLSPTKRVKRQTGLPSSTRQSPTKSDTAPSMPSTPRLPRSNSGMPSPGGAFTTPTKTPLSRSASVKSLKTNKSMIPAFVKSPSTNSLTTFAKVNLAVPQTEGSNKYRNAIANKLTNVKSILRRPQIRFSDDPVKVAAGTHMSTPISNRTGGVDINKPLPSDPNVTPGTPAYRKEKHVNFAVSQDTVASPRIGTPVTPSPAKLSIGYPLAGSDVSYPSLPLSLALGGHNAEDEGYKSPSRSALGGPADFTFRADQTINFVSTPTTPTIRKVSGNDAPASASKPSGTFAGVAHGLSNKKRKREGDDLEKTENKENEAELPVESPSKRLKVMSKAGQASSSVQSPKAKRANAATTPKAKSRGVLSLSRLNALARPKDRK